MGASQWRKLVTKQEKEKLDEWYVRNASLWLADRHDDHQTTAERPRILSGNFG
jgi:hypothetical protein